MPYRLPPSPSQDPSPVRGANGKNPSAHASVACRTLGRRGEGFSLAPLRLGGGPPSGHQTSEPFGGAAIQTAEGEFVV